MIRMIVNMGSSSEAMLKYLLGIWLIWGMNWVVMKSANEYFDPAVFVAWRFGTGALILLGINHVNGIIPSPSFANKIPLYARLYDALTFT